MIQVSDKWKEVQQRFLLPESLIEINCEITEEGAQESATASGANQEFYSNVGTILGKQDTVLYATNEQNIWALNGTFNILPNSNYGNAGYVSNIASTGSITLSFPEVRTTAISGLTITWGRDYGEFARVFTVTAKNGGTVVSEMTVTDNKDQVSAVYMKVANYNSITVTVHDWSLPNRRARIEKIVIGHILTLTKSDILSYTHEMEGDLLSGELPKYHIEFTLDNTDGRWNPTNPTGMEQYLSERQRLTVRYGFNLDGTIEWIPAGVFYLSEWDAPSNGLEARFVARDVFEFLSTDTSKLPSMSATQHGNLASIVDWATKSRLPAGASVVMDDALRTSAERDYGADGTYAEMVQKCANAACCIIRYDREGVLHIEPLNTEMSEYLPVQLDIGAYGIPLSLSYAYPQIVLSKPLERVVVDYGGENPYEGEAVSEGETQTVTNDYIYTEQAAQAVAAWVKDVLTSRKTVSGEYRADPRLDLYDVIVVESKYGHITPVVITSIKYTFNGSFHGTYEGRVLEGAT